MKNRSAFSLIEILVVLVVLMVLAAILMPRLLGGRTLDGKTIKSPQTAARETVCRSNLSQLRSAIQIHKIGNDKDPESLADLKLPFEMTHCVVGNEEYRYEAGEVHCPHLGHEAY